MPNFAFKALRVSRTLDFTLIKFTMPAACNSSVHAGAPATMNMALSPIARYAGIAYSAYSSSLEQRTTMSAFASNAALTHKRKQK